MSELLISQDSSLFPAHRDSRPGPQQLDTLDFQLPPELEATEPPEVRGLGRDDVRLMVSQETGNVVRDLRFREVSEVLSPGDLLVINTSGTMNAALPATREDGTEVELHLSTHLPGDVWTVELRLAKCGKTEPYSDGRPGETLHLPAGGAATLLAPYSPEAGREWRQVVPTRLWLARLQLPGELLSYLAEHGHPIRYGYVRTQWPSSYYQTVYATEIGSAEMPSAGRPFTPEIITSLVSHGIGVAPLILHTGVASLEDHEPPYEEYYRVPPATARAINSTHAAGGKVVAVGTTVVRALETVTDLADEAHPGEGWTGLIITPERAVRCVDGLLTGLHEPRATHLAMLQALVGREHLEISYTHALRERYLWHEFGDLHLILR